MSTIEKYKPYGENGTCNICQEDPRNGDLIWILGSCNHMYHKSCIEPWAERSNTCPTCRRPFVRPTEIADAAKFQKTLAYAFTVKIVNSLAIKDYVCELPTIRRIIRKYSLNNIQINPADIDTKTFDSFYKSYKRLEAEMRQLYSAPTGLTMIPIIQALIRRQINYAPMYYLINRY